MIYLCIFEINATSSEKIKKKKKKKLLAIIIYQETIGILKLPNPGSNTQLDLQFSGHPGRETIQKTPIGCLLW